MPKPIVVIYFPDNFYLGPNDASPASIMHVFNGDHPRIEPHPAMLDYLWFCFSKYGIDAPEFQVFHPKDFTEIEFNDLKQIVLNHLNENYKQPS